MEDWGHVMAISYKLSEDEKLTVLDNFITHMFIDDSRTLEKMKQSLIKKNSHLQGQFSLCGFMYEGERYINENVHWGNDILELDDTLVEELTKFKSRLKNSTKVRNLIKFIMRKVLALAFTIQDVHTLLPSQLERYIDKVLPKHKGERPSPHVTPDIVEDFHSSVHKYVEEVSAYLLHRALFVED